ncbi:hypothetical protein K7X08_028924 [Anisodus acutangulus]|uniref:Uncharacterized protein n=1 Tax=Anisodus acutangulus TaxID=402998 RepID=A0A9Q1L458_9SOLA|nr:hypothetical protein K7X08_028924 [Anisodus acutangulus]
MIESEEQGDGNTNEWVEDVFCTDKGTSTPIMEAQKEKEDHDQEQKRTDEIIEKENVQHQCLISSDQGDMSMNKVSDIQIVHN